VVPASGAVAGPSWIRGSSSSRCRNLAAGVCGQFCGRGRVGEQEAGVDVFQHKSNPFERVFRVDGNIGAAGFQNCQDGDQEAGGAADAEGHHSFGADAFPAQIACEAG